MVGVTRDWPGPPWPGCHWAPPGSCHWCHWWGWWPGCGGQWGAWPGPWSLHSPAEQSWVRSSSFWDWGPEQTASGLPVLRCLGQCTLYTLSLGWARIKSIPADHGLARTHRRLARPACAAWLWTPGHAHGLSSWVQGTLDTLPIMGHHYQLNFHCARNVGRTMSLTIVHIKSRDLHIFPKTYSTETSRREKIKLRKRSANLFFVLLRRIIFLNKSIYSLNNNNILIEIWFALSSI